MKQVEMAVFQQNIPIADTGHYARVFTRSGTYPEGGWVVEETPSGALLTHAERKLMFEARGFGYCLVYALPIDQAEKLSMVDPSGDSSQMVGGVSRPIKATGKGRRAAEAVKPPSDAFE